MQLQRQAYIALHSAVLLFALSGLFGKWLTVSAFDIVFGRALFAAIAIAFYIGVVKRQSLYITKLAILPLCISGVLLATHWSSFFYAIQVSTVSLGLFTFATFPVMVSLLEPWVSKESLRWQNIVLALITLVGVYLVLPEGVLGNNSYQGALWGLISAFTFALLTIANKKFVVQYSAKVVAGYQNAVAAAVLLPFVGLFTYSTSLSTWGVLALLGIVFTALSHSLYNFSLKRLTGHTAALAVSLEPIYGTVAAYFLLNEQVTTTFIIGAMLILFTNMWVLVRR